MSETGLKRWQFATWAIRVAYLTALLVIGVICALFYTEQSKQHNEVNSIRKLDHQFAITDALMTRLAEKALKISEVLPSKGNNLVLAKQLAGKTFKQRKTYLASLPVDSDILTHKIAIAYIRDKVEVEQKKLEAIWENSPDKVKKLITKTSRFMKSYEPFKHHRKFIDPSRLVKARTKVDMYWAAREFTSHFKSMVEPSNIEAENILQEYLANLLSEQGALLERFRG